jgi:flagellar hook protein FlgE
MSFLKDDTVGKANNWHVEVRVDPASDLEPATDAGLLESGDLTFKPDGTVDTTASAAFLTKLDALTIGDSKATTGKHWAADLGIDKNVLKIDPAGLTQLSGASAVNKVSVDGTPFGSLSGVSVDDAGMVTAIFANGSTRKIAQLAIATFTNPDGLSPTSGDSFSQTGNSGAYSLKSAGTGGAGKISPSSLEASTVDLSTEFTGLNTTQRAYSASSKIITTADQMLEQLLAIKQ